MGEIVETLGTVEKIEIDAIFDIVRTGEFNYFGETVEIVEVSKVENIVEIVETVDVFEFFEIDVT